MEQSAPDRWTTVVLVIWGILFVPWIPFAFAAGMAFDGGYTPGAYVFVGSVWTYPLVCLIAAILKERVRWLVLLPGLNVIVCLISGL
jgi:hypothetical protein